MAMHSVMARVSKVIVELKQKSQVPKRTVTGTVKSMVQHSLSTLIIIDKTKMDTYIYIYIYIYAHPSNREDSNSDRLDFQNTKEDQTANKPIPVCIT
jgi:hypothetical protein